MRLPPVTRFAPFVLAATLSACVIVVPDGDSKYSYSSGDSAIQGDGRIARETRPVTAVAGLEIEGRKRLDLDVDVQVGAAPSLEIEGDANLLPYIRVETRGDTLRIWADRDARSTQPVRVRYTVPALARLESSGAAGTHVGGLNGGALNVTQRGSGRIELRGRVDRLEAVNSGSGSLQADTLETAGARVTLNGSGRVTLGALSGDELQAQVYGSGDLDARGNVRQARVTLYGSGDAHLAGLRAADANLTTNGSGDIAIAVSGRVETQTNGSGSITVYGEPAERSVSGKRTTFVR